LDLIHSLSLLKGLAIEMGMIECDLSLVEQKHMISKPWYTIPQAMYIVRLMYLHACSLFLSMIDMAKLKIVIILVTGCKLNTCSHIPFE
jgi:hypothetical protein